MEENKRKILIIMGRYLPGYRDGGPVRSIKNLVDYLGDDYQFQILTCDRDHGDEAPYPNIIVNNWNQVGNARVYYVKPKRFTFNTILKLSKKSDLIYICGCFNDYAIKTLILKRLKLIKKPVIVAAMGLFSPMEFQLKYKKKKLFTTIFNMFGMFKSIYWSATSPIEVEEIKQQIKCYDNLFIAEDLPRKVEEIKVNKNKVSGELDIVWISRIAPKKNLIGAIKILQKVNSKIKFTIYGPIHDEVYWSKCLQQLKELPINICWEYNGNVDSEEVVEKLKKHQVFLFPTLGENYGHVIQEALSAGCLCLLSDQTPWIDLEENNVGFSHSIESIDFFVNKIEQYAQLSLNDFQNLSAKAITYAMEKSNNKIENSGYRRIFNIEKDDI